MKSDPGNRGGWAEVRGRRGGREVRGEEAGEKSRRGGPPAHLLGDRVDEPDVQVLLGADACGGGGGHEVRATEPLSAPKPVPAVGTEARAAAPGSRLQASTPAVQSWRQRPPTRPWPCPSLPQPCAPQAWRLPASDCKVVSRPPSKRNMRAPQPALGAHHCCRGAVTYSGCRCWSSRCLVPEKTGSVRVPCLPALPTQ